MACLALWKAYKLLNNKKIADAYHRSLQAFQKYHIDHEGWSLEYDGIDPGYLSATVSFLGKIYKDNKSSEVRKIIEQSVQMCSYFIYPNGFYGGSLGSRNTLHFYPHGFEIIGKKYPLATAVAEKMLLSLSKGKLVPPEIISDRYVVYRVPEYLLSYVDYCRRPKKLPEIPYERNDFEKYFKKAGIYINKTKDRYLIANLAKGGVIKYFNTQNNLLMLNDSGIIGTLDNLKTVTTQWVDPKYKIKVKKDNVSVFGQMNYIPAFKLFNPIKNILFRLTLIAFGWNSSFSHLLKGWIRNILITSDKKAPIHFRRSFKVSKDQLVLSDEVTWSLDVKFKSLSIGDEFFIRYVPQSRYFQSQELDTAGLVIDSKSLDIINDSKRYTRKISLR